jgi:ankyrin repeat protein
LLAQLHFDSLIGIRSPKAIHTTLGKLATGNNAYDFAYNEAMGRIEGQVKHQNELAKEVLSWITCAKRPLFISELQHALAVEIGEVKLDEENMPQIEDIVSVCAGLVTVDKGSNIIRLVHYTTQEYFDRTREKWFPNADTDITTICVTYLSFDKFESGVCQNDKEFEHRLQSNKLYDYAAYNWGHHVQEASTPCQGVMEFLRKQAQAEAAIQGLMAFKQWPWQSQYSQQIPKQMTGLHLASYFGIHDAVRDLLGSNDPDLKDSYNRTPLSWAAKNGHGAVVKLLLDTSKVDADSKDMWGQTALSLAAENGHETVVQLLFEHGAEPESKDVWCQTPLLLAALNGQEAILRLLLDQGVELELKDKWDRTPLSWAAENGHEAVVKLLLAKGNVDPDSKDAKSQTPLSYAAQDGHEAIIELLLNTNHVEADSKDIYGQTPLSYAAEMGHDAVVELLLANDSVDPDSKDRAGWTPLSRVAQTGHETVVRLLLANNRVDANSKSQDGETPLLRASGNGHKGVVKLLLATGQVDVDAKDNDGRTPLSWAADNGHEAVVKLLLDTGKVNVDLKGNDS